MISPRAPRVALVTGGCGGLGRATVKALVADAWRVIVGYNQHPWPPCDGDIHPIALDVSRGAAVTAAFASINQTWGGIDLLVNNAGAADDRLLCQMQDEEWERIVNVNLTGAFRCARAAFSSMISRGGGHIINIGSVAGRRGRAGQTNYAAAKAGLLGLNVSLAREAGPHNIAVNAVIPGVMSTAMTEGLSAAQLEELRQSNVLGRLGTVEEVARFIAFLATLRDVSGQVFQLDSRLGAP